MDDLTEDPLAGAPEPDRFVDALVDGLDEFIGSSCVYRLAYTGMEAPDLPEQLTIGRVRLSRVVGPIHTQRTSVVQRPGDTLVFDKDLHANVAIGARVPMTLLEIEDDLPGDPADAIDAWHSEATAAAGAIAALLDERLFQRPVLEDVLLLGPDGSEVVGVVDARLRLRHFVPYPITAIELDSLARIGSRLPEHSALAVGARWYLKGAQAGPVADGVVSLWIAIDAR